MRLAGIVALAVAMMAVATSFMPQGPVAVAGTAGAGAGGGIPFPIWNVSLYRGEDRYPSMAATGSEMRLMWDKGFEDLFNTQAVMREYDGVSWRAVEKWVAMDDPTEHNATATNGFFSDCVAAGYRGSTYFVFASDDNRFTPGTDYDILLRQLDPATSSWGPVTSVTPNHPGQDRHPSVAVLKDRLVVAWTATDPAHPGDDDVLMRTYDGAAFGEVVEVSQADNSARDWGVDIAVVGDDLALVWQWNNRTVRPDDYDTMFREWDGTGFTGPPVDISVDPSRVDKGPRVASVGGAPFVVWESAPASGGTGGIAVQGRSVGPEGPSGVVAVTRSDASSSNVHPDVVTANGTAYVFWSTNDDGVKHGPDMDVVYRSYDGERLGPIVEVSDPNDDGLNETYVTVCLFKGNLYAAWMATIIDAAAEDGVNLEVMCRRVTEFTAEIAAVFVPAKDSSRPIEGRIHITVEVRDFMGNLAEPDIYNGLVMVNAPPNVERYPNVDWYPDLNGEGGLYNCEIHPPLAGEYEFVYYSSDHQIASVTVTVPPADEQDISVSVGYAVVASIAIAAGLVAVFLGMRKR
jgi:hypothetical protein